MKEAWLLADGENWEEEKEKIKDAIEIGYTGVVVREEFADKAKKLGRLKVFAKKNEEAEGNGERAVFVDISSAEDQERAVKLSEEVDYLFLSFSDWKIIPLENLIAMKKKAKLIAIVNTLEDAKVVLTTLEKGADGIAVREDRREILRQYHELASGEKGYVELKRAKITEIKPLGVGDRVCIDTVTLMEVGEGMLVGNSSGGMFLVHAETEENPYVASRPFRVNAGAVHMYIRVPGGKTKYLCELNAGDEVMIYNYKGEGRIAYVGRSKVERRPMLLIEGVYDKKRVSCILQNAETIRLTKPDGSPVSVVELKEGDEVLGYVEEAGRHFGMKVEETIIEK